MFSKQSAFLVVLPFLVASHVLAQQTGQQSSQQASPYSLVQLIDPSNARIAYTGRWNFSDPSQPWCGWQGTSIRVRVARGAPRSTR